MNITGKITKHLIFNLFLAIPTLLKAQNENVLFDLDKGAFNVEKIPYTRPISITGDADKNGEELDAIRLTVTKVTADEKEKLDAIRFRAGELDKAIDKASKGKDNLSGILSETTIDKEKISSKFPSLADSIENITNDAKLKEIIQKEIKGLTKELEEYGKTKIKQEADILKLETSIAKAIIYDGVWQRTNGSKEFNFSLGRNLKMAEKYDFKFAFFKINRTSYPIDKLLDPLIDDFDETLNDAGFYSKEAIQKRVNEVTNTIEKDIFPKIFALQNQGTEVVSKGLHLDDAKIADLTENLTNYYVSLEGAKGEEENVAKKLKEVDDKISENNGLTVAQQSVIEKIIGSSEGDIGKLRDALNSAMYESAQIEEIIELFNELKGSRDLYNTNNDNVVKYLTLINEEFDYIKSLYVEDGSVTKSGQAESAGATEVEGIRISTIYGLGIAQLENNFNAIEWYQFIGVNIRFDDFDNRLPGKKAYKNFKSRWSVLIGFTTTSDMQYRGQNLENLRIGFKPVIGLSFEPIKHLSISSGIISFIPSSIGNSQRDPKVRPYISLGFDFNLFNYLIQKQ